MNLVNQRCQLILSITALALAFLPGSGKSNNPVNTDSLLRVLEQADSHSAKVHVMVRLSQAYSLADMDLAISYSQMAVWEAEKSEDEDLLAVSLYNAMRICFRCGLFDQATEYFTRHLELIEKKGSMEEIAKGNFNMGSIWLSLEKYDQAESAFNQWLQYHQSMPLTKDAGQKIANYYNNMGLIKASRQELQEAARFYEKGIAALLQDNYGSDAAIRLQLFQNYSDVLIKMGKNDAAIDQLKNVLDIYTKIGDKPAMGIALLSLGKAHRGLGEKKQAMAFYQRAYELSQQSGALSNLSIIAQEMQSLYKETGPSDSTLKYLSLYNEYTEKLKEEEARFALNHQELLTNFRAREHKILFRQRMIFLGYLFLALVLLAVATWLFIKTRRNLRQSNLVKMNLELARQRLELENDSLKSEVEQKNKELAANTMYSLQKNELIGSVVEKLLEQFKSKTPISPDALRPVIRELEQSKDDKIWEEFEVNFSKVHADFYKNLNQINPDLTPNERRLCAFLKLNMSTKDISAITGQTPHSIKIARARLRKKFNLTNSDTSLLAFLAET